MNNVSASIVEGTSKSSGKPYHGVIFKVKTSQGVYETRPIFPTSLEFQLVKDAIAPSNDDFLDFEN